MHSSSPAKISLASYLAKKRADGSGWNIYRNGGRIDMGIDAVEWAIEADRLGAGRARIGRSGDIQKYQLIRSRLVIGRSDLCRVSRVLKIYKIYPFNNPSVLHVQAGVGQFGSDYESKADLRCGG